MDGYYDEFEPGNVVFGRYKVLHCVGIGSLGTVYACSIINNPLKKIALKVLSQKAAQDEKLVTLFRNEIHTSYRVSHANVVRCHEFFRDGDTLAISMEYVEGNNLSRLIQKQGRLTIELAVSILTQLCKGLEAIHQAGIIHQDLKPQNIIVGSNGIVKITDFTAAQTGRPMQSFNANADVQGTMEFLSPETIVDGIIDYRSDIYSLGTITYLMVTGQLPFYGQNMMTSMQSKLYGSPLPPRHHNPACPELLSRIILTAIARNPEHRFQSTLDIISAIESPVETPRRSGIFNWLFGGVTT